MQSSLIYSLHNAPTLMRSISATVIVTFTMLILTPTVVAARTELDKTAKATTSTNTISSAESKLSQTLQAVESQLQQMSETSNQPQARARQLKRRQKSSSDSIQTLQNLKQQLITLDKEVLANFQQIESELLERQLPQVILDRHQQTVDRYRAEINQLLNELDNVTSANSDNDRLNKVEQVINHLKEKRNKRSQQPFDPSQLPNSNLKAKPDNKPKQTKKEFTQAGLHSTPYPQLAALGDFTFDKLAGANNPAYLAETTEIKITQTIKDKAAELNHDPVKIHNWVRNNIQWQPTWGAIQDSEFTLSAKRGNAMDIASLTIALLRASEIPTRYVHGTIDIPAEAFNNWIGDFSNINDAADYAASGGIPITTLISGGQIKKIRLEHIWVEAAIDYYPSRGAVNKDADSWIQMDPSYKQYEYLTGLDLITISGIDPQVMAQSFIDSGTVNEAESWVTGFNPAIIETAQTQAQQKLESYTQNNLTNPTVGEVIGERKTIITNYPVLPSSLANKVVVAGARYDQLPSQLKYRLTLELFNSSLDQSLGSPALTYTLPLPQIGTRRLGISYHPTSQADVDALQSQIDSNMAALSVYLISLKPVITLDEIELISGTGIMMGSDQLLDVIIHSPQSNYRMSYKSQIAGDEMVVSMNGGGVDFNQVTARAESVVTDSAGENLHRIGLNYWAEADFFTNATASFLNTKAIRLPSVGLLGSPLSITYNFGIPRLGYYFQRTIDIKRNVHAIGTTDQALRRDFLLQTGFVHSYLESSIFEQVLNHWHGTAVSAAQVLVDANQQQIPIYLLNKSNMGAVLPLLTVSSEVILDIQNAVNAGLEVIIPKRQPDKPVGAAAMGYVLFDPVTGAGSYRISGGLEGGGSIGPCQEAELQSLQQALREKILTYTVLAELAILTGGRAGGLAGGVAPEVVPVLKSLMSAVGLSALTFDATAGGLCNVLETKRQGGNSAGAIRSGLCADLVIKTVYQGKDACLNGVDFDAWTISTLWEVKVINLKNTPDLVVDFQIKKDLKQLERQKAALASCPQYQYGWAVADLRHFTRQKVPFGWDLLVNIHRHVPECFLLIP